MSCTVNPLAGRERERPPRPPSPTPQRWVVVGGGPAGMRAAVELASDGHAVTLLERAQELGGQLRLARAVPGRDSIQLLVDDLRRDLARAGVDVRLGVQATVDLLAEMRSDGVVLATGAIAPQGSSLDIGGAYAGGFPREGTVDAFTAAARAGDLGRRIAVVDSDGTAYASGVLLMLLDAADELTLVTPFETVFPHVGAGYDRPLLLETLGAHGGFERLVSHQVADVRRDGLDLVDTVTARRTSLEGLDAIVAIEPRASVRMPPLPGLHGVRVVTIGDAFSPRTIDAAIFEAVEFAYDVAGMGSLRG